MSLVKVEKLHSETKKKADNTTFRGDDILCSKEESTAPSPAPRGPIRGQAGTTYTHSLPPSSPLAAWPRVDPQDGLVKESVVFIVFSLFLYFLFIHFFVTLASRRSETSKLGDEIRGDFILGLPASLKKKCSLTQKLFIRNKVSLMTMFRRVINCSFLLFTVHGTERGPGRQMSPEFRLLHGKCVISVETE